MSPPLCVTCGYWVPTIGDQCETCATGGRPWTDATTVPSIPSGGPDGTATCTTTDPTTTPRPSTPGAATSSGSGPDQTRSEWLAWRRAGIGGSDVAGILGLSPWASPYSVWMSKVAELDDEDNERFEFGRRAEPMLGQWFEDRTGLYVAGEQTWCAHRDMPWARCTVDGFVFEHDGPGFIDDAIAIAEWKTTSEPPWDEVPAHYACQATWSMYVCDLPAVFFGVLHFAYGRPTFRTYEFARDEADERYVVERCRAFYERHVLTGEPPPVDAHKATTDALRGQWEGTGGIVEADIDALALVEEYRYHRAQVRAAEDDLEAAGNRLRALLGDDVELHSAGRKLVTNKPQTRTTVDTTRMRKAWPDLVRDFEQTAETRVLRVNEPKEK